MKKHYQIIVNWSNAGQAFLAEVPELSGCIADGKSFDEAVANVKLYMEEWFAMANLPANFAPSNVATHYYA
jgi:predicted RNase H-like HicB family nuclease